MKKVVSFLIAVVCSVNLCFGQKNYWKKVEPTSEGKKGILSNRLKTSSISAIYKLDTASFLHDLGELQSSRKAFVQVKFPDVEGKVRVFDVYPYEVMDEALAAKYPEIKTYRGSDENEDGSRIYITTTPIGVQVLLKDFGVEDTFIEAVEGTKDHYEVKTKTSFSTKESFKCLGVVADKSTKSAFGLFDRDENVSSDGKLREYRFAVATTIEYSRFHLRRTDNMQADMRTKKAVVLSAVAMTVNRLNSILEGELGIRLKLVANNDKILFIGENDEFSNNNANALLEESQEIIDREIGFDNYDLGHTMSTGAGGLASLGGLGTDRKAKGVTGSSSPVGDSYDIDFVLHEVGHQLGANHTFTNYHNGAVNYATVYEPGSGSTIMGYAGISKPNIQEHADAYFHFVSLEEMKTVIQRQSHIGKVVEGKLSVPKVNAGKDYVIPKGTPFKLEGTVDNEYDMRLLYTWEQADRGLLNQPPQPQYKEGANFRSIRPSELPVRYFPAYTDVLEGKKTEWEVLPTVDREMHFVFTARDLSHYNGGLTSSDAMTLRIANVDPFEITQFGKVNSNGVIEVNEGGKTTINWSANGTDANGINTKFIDIYLSKDDGVSYEAIKRAVFNNGSTDISIPYGLSDRCRIMLQPINNVYYAVSKPFKIVPSAKASAMNSAVEEKVVIYPNPTAGKTFITFESNSGQEIIVTLYDLSMHQVYKRAFPNEEKFHQEVDFGNLGVGVYVVTVEDGIISYSGKILIKK